MENKHGEEQNCEGAWAGGEDLWVKPPSISLIVLIHVFPMESNWKLIRVLLACLHTQIRMWLFFAARYPLTTIIALTFQINMSCSSLCAPGIVAMTMLLKQETSLPLKWLWHSLK